MQQIRHKSPSFIAHSGSFVRFAGPSKQALTANHTHSPSLVTHIRSFACLFELFACSFPRFARSFTRSELSQSRSFFQKVAHTGVIRAQTTEECAGSGPFGCGAGHYLGVGAFYGVQPCGLGVQQQAAGPDSKTQTSGRFAPFVLFFC